MTRMNHLDGWVMNECGVEKSWMKLFSLGQLDTVGAMGTLRPVAYLRGNKRVLLQHDRDFLALDVKDNSVKKVSIHGHSGISSAQICPGSLFRLGDSGVAAAKRLGVKRKSKLTPG